MGRKQYTTRGYLFVIISLILLVSLLIYESWMQSHYPEQSILYLLHQKGILLNYEIAFEPNKGIWFDMGWIGTVLFIIMMCYPLRNRLPFIKRIENRSLMLDIHMACGIIGTILITFHTTFKLRGIVSISFWAMIVVALSGIYGRFLYINIKNKRYSTEILKNWLWIHRPLTIIMFLILLLHIVVIYLFRA